MRVPSPAIITATRVPIVRDAARGYNWPQLGTSDHIWRNIANVVNIA
jgi:hypothetical protein